MSSVQLDEQIIKGLRKRLLEKGLCDMFLSDIQCKTSQ